MFVVVGLADTEGVAGGSAAVVCRFLSSTISVMSGCGSIVEVKSV